MKISHTAKCSFVYKLPNMCFSCGHYHNGFHILAGSGFSGFQRLFFFFQNWCFCFLVDFVESMVRAVSFLRPELHVCPAVTAQA